MSIFFFKPVRKKAVIISLIASGDKCVAPDLNLLIIIYAEKKYYRRKNQLPEEARPFRRLYDDDN